MAKNNTLPEIFVKIDVVCLLNSKEGSDGGRIPALTSDSDKKCESRKGRVMSELIDNREKRLEDLLAFSLGMMNGEDGRVLIEKYRSAIDNMTPHDMLELEDRQVRMGVSAAAIKRDIEKILNVFYASLKQYPWEKPAEGTFLYYLMLENQALVFKLNQIKKVLKRIKMQHGGDFSQVQRELLPMFHELTEFEYHYIKKENILFPYLEKVWTYYRPLTVMWSLHDDIRKKLKTIVAILKNEYADWEKFNIEMSQYFFLAFGMVQKEDLIIYPVATETVDDTAWQEMYAQSFDYVFPFIEKPEKLNNLSLDSRNNEDFSIVSHDGAIQFTTGNLSFQQALLAFDHLPVDITFVDKNNKVRFFNRAKDRFFPRSPAIIGRDVKNCHPPESVHIVEKIIEEFRTGKKDHADFWIQMQGKFILIRYYAIRDDGGEYQGVLEVSEDITDIRTLEGEKRLLDWD